MTFTPSLVQRRAAALALLMVALAAVWFGVTVPIMGHFSDHAEQRLADIRALRRDRALIAQAPRTRTALESLKESPRWARFYEGQKPEAAILEMETDLRRLIATPNNPTSMVAQAVSIQGPLTRIAVKVTLSMPIDQLVDTLQRLQGHTKFLEIQNVLIQAPDYEAADSNPVLSVQADIAAYLAPGATRT